MDAAARHADALRETGNGIANLVRRIDVTDDALAISVDPTRVLFQTDLQPIRIEHSFELRQSGRAKPIVIGTAARTVERDPDLITLIADARRWPKALRSDEAVSVQAITDLEGLAKGAVSRVLPLAHLAPDIAEAILDGGQPAALTAKRLRSIAACRWTGPNSAAYSASKRSEQSARPDAKPRA